MNPEDLGSLAPPTGPIPGTGYAVQVDRGGYEFTAPKYPGRAGPLNLAFGSGKTGMTYVGVGPDSLSAAQMSYFPRLHRWFLTPGHVARPAYVLGASYGPDFSVKCVRCHTTTLEGGGLMPMRQDLGVQCEACHGPGSAHAGAMRAGIQGALGIDNPTQWGAARIIALCGKCHSAGAATGASGAGTRDTHRFQSDGLTQSSCYRLGGHTLSCITCHDPHTDATRDRAHYEAVCVGCHNPAPRADRAATGSRAKRCPVNAKAGCVSCHMPRRRIFSDSSVPTALAEHRIGIYQRNR